MSELIEYAEGRFERRRIVPFRATNIAVIEPFGKP